MTRQLVLSLLLLPFSSPFRQAALHHPHMLPVRSHSGSLARRVIVESSTRRRTAVRPCAGSASPSSSNERTVHEPNVFKLFYNDIYKFPLPEKHRFPMGKYKVVRERIQHAGACNIDLEPSPLAKQRDLRATHCPEYIKRFLCNMLTERENRNIGFPWSTAGVKRALSSVGGTVAAAHAVCSGQHVFSGHIAGGTHHAFFDYGEGFCVFSDIAVAANVVLRDYPEFERILIVDCDVHQGNGNAVLFAEDPRVTTFSMHCAGNYFSQKQVSDFDVEVPVGCSDDYYLGELEIWLPRVMAFSRPQLIFFQAGVDPLGNDKMGKCNLTVEGLRERNAKVFAAALRWQCKLVVTMGGGYPKDLSEDSDDFRKVVAAHTDVYLQAAQALTDACDDAEDTEMVALRPFAN